MLAAGVAIPSIREALSVDTTSPEPESTIAKYIYDTGSTRLPEKTLRSGWLACIHFGVRLQELKAVADHYYRWNTALALAFFWTRINTSTSVEMCSGWSW